jgi:hypothetical protein
MYMGRAVIFTKPGESQNHYRQFKEIKLKNQNQKNKSVLKSTKTRRKFKWYVSKSSL